MEKNLKIFLIVLAAVIILMILWGVISYFKKGRRKGRAAERKVAGVIKKLGKNDKIRVINNAFLPLYRKTVEMIYLDCFSVKRKKNSRDRSSRFWTFWSSCR